MSGGYCDLHNHTLPGVDDGARDMEDALRMAGMAAQDGITTVLLTPHNRDVQEAMKEGRLHHAVEELRAAVTAQGIPVSFVLSMENHLTPDLPRLVDEGLALRINRGPYILVEFPFSEVVPVYADEVLFALQLKGLIPVIAHPERCDALVERPQQLEAYVSRGMLAQVTSMSILGRFGPEARTAAESFLRQGLAQVIASDAHSSRGPRVPLVSEAVQAAARIVGQQRAQDMASAIPWAMLEGKPVKPQPRPEGRRRRTTS